MYENIEKCLQENNTIDMAQVPEVCIIQKCYEARKPYEKYHNIKTGEVTRLKSDNTFTVYPGSYNKNQGIPYIKYYEDYELLEISVIQFDAHRDKKGGIREFEFAGPRVFFDKNKQIYINAFTDWERKESVIKKYEYGNNLYYSIPNYDHRGQYNTYPRDWKQYLSAVSNLSYGVPLNIDINNYCKLIGMEEVPYFRVFEIKFKEAKKRVVYTKAEERAKELNALVKNYGPLKLKALKIKYDSETLKLPCKPDEIRDYKTTCDYYDYILEAEKVSNDIGVIRIFRSGVDSTWVREEGGGYHGHYEVCRRFPIEAYRLFITPTEVIELHNPFCYPKVDGTIPEPQWYRTTYIEMSRAWRNNVYVADIEALCNCQQRVKYLEPIIKELYKDKLGKSVYECIPHCLRHPTLEQLIKMGCIEIGKEILENGQINAGLTEIFGPARWDNKTTPLLKKIGVNKAQLQYVEEEMKKTHARESRAYRDTEMIKELRLMYPELNLADLSLDDFKYKVKEADLIKFCFYGCNGENKYQRLSPHEMREDALACEKLVKRVVKIALREENPREIMGLYRDGLNMYSNLQDTEFEYNYDFNNLQGKSDIVRFHDACLALNDARLAERRRLEALAEDERNKELEKKMVKIQKERKEKFPYEDEQFFIKVPEHLSEITTEGAVLHHCVGGYVNDHASGRTNIMFLRKKTEPDRQFYTVEVRDNEIVQIHGANNKWLGCDPEAIPFIKRWIRDKKLICSKKIYLSKSTGYWANDTDLVPDPEI